MFESFVIRKFLIPSFVAAKRSRIVILPMLLASAIERLYDLHVGTTPVEEGSPFD
jgi:hypothetical protein